MFRILVVDDEKNNLRAIERIFIDESDCELKYSDNGYDAIQLTENFAPDVILLDINMPNMSGYEVCQKIKSNANTAKSMILFLSGLDQLSDRLKGYEALADDFIAKPFEAKELIAKTRILLRLKKTQDELRDINLNLENVVVQKTRQLVVKERQAIVGRMVHGIVHNLQNPLIVANGFVNRIEKIMKLLIPYTKKWPPEQQHSVEQVNENIEIVIESLDRIQEMVANLLQKGRKEMTDKYQKLNLNEIITSEIKFLEADIEMKHNVIKKFHLDSHLPEFFGNYADFSQVCSNLIKNAVDAMQDSSIKKITITTKHDAENIYIYFKDTGQGILPQIIDKVFEPFFTTKALKGEEKGEEPTGTGIGLYSCQQMMKAYNGTITVESETQVSTIFTLILPYTESNRNGKIITSGDKGI